MKVIKKYLSLFLVLCMVLSLAPANVLAAETTPGTAVEVSGNSKAVSDNNVTEEEPEGEEASKESDEDGASKTEKTEEGSADQKTSKAETTEEGAADEETSKAETAEEESTDEESSEEETSEEETRSVSRSFRSIALSRQTTLSAAGDDDFYKIVHLDAGRKYFTVDQIKTLIDEMSERGLNQLELYLADNQGFRLALNDMSVTVGDKTYDLTSSLGDGYAQDSTPSANDNHFKPDSNGTKGYLTEYDMSVIIAYARSKGVEIVPCINVPGHMGAILNPDITDDDETDPDNPYAQFCYKASDGTVSKSSIDLTNADAVEFALAITQKYVNFFAAQGCKYYSIGADEYCYDLGYSDLTWLIDAGLYDDYISFLNSAAGIITGKGMTPRAFNDAFYLDESCKIDEAYQVYVWSNASSTLQRIIENGHDVINTSSGIYWAIGSSWAEESQTISGLNSFNYKQFNGGTVDNPAGAMFCIWNDVASLRTGDYIINKVSETDGMLDLFAKALENAGPVVINLAIDETYSETFSVTGTYTAEELEGALGIGEYVAVSDVNTIPGTPAGEPEKKSSMAAGDTIIIGDGTNYLLLDGTTLKQTTDPGEATQWTVTENGGFQLGNGTNYLDCQGSLGITSSWSGAKWVLDETGLHTINNWATNGVYYLSYDSTAETWSATTTQTSTAVYKQGTAATPDTTTFKLTGTANGTEKFTAADGTAYKVIVGTGIVDHECNTNITATCMSPAACSICGATTGDVDPDNHIGFLIPATCESYAKCSCGAEDTESGYAAHKYADPTCKDTGICEVCGTQDPKGTVGAHDYSEANCQTAATCSVCGATDGEKDLTVHAGETELKNAKKATDTEEGYTGDLYCKECGTLIATGVIIPRIESGVKEIAIAVGGSKNIEVEGKDYSAETGGDELDESIADITIIYKEAESAGQPVKQESIAAGDTILLGDGTNFLVLDGTDLKSTQNPDEATRWTVGDNQGLEFKNGTSFLSCSKGTLTISTEGYSPAKWVLDETGLHTTNNWATDGIYYLNYDAETATWSTAAAQAGITAYLSGSPATPAKSTITFTGVKEGVTYATIDGIRYKISVVSEELLSAALPVNLWITNSQAKFVDNDTTYTITSIGALDAAGLATQIGAALEDVVPQKGRSDQGESDSDIVLWRGMLHTDTEKQIDTSSGNNAPDMSQKGKQFNYIRFYENKWEVSANRVTWTEVGDNVIDIYYLQETQVTQEVITEVVDWGWDYDKYTSGMAHADTFVLLDFAVYLDGVGRTPKLTEYPNNGRDDGGKNQKTIAFHCYNDTSDDKIYQDAAGNYVRRIDTIYAEDTDQYEVYMITLTRTSDTPDVKLTSDTVKTSADLVGKNYSYVGEEKIVWTIDEETFEQKVDTDTIDENKLGAFALRPADYSGTKEDKKTIYRTVGGDPVVDYVQIYRNQGMLVTYYVRAKETQDSLAVHYRLEGSTEDFHNYNIAVQTDNFFSNQFVADGGDETNETGLLNNTVTNYYGRTHTVTSDLTKLMDVPSRYRTGSYRFTYNVQLVLEDGTVLPMNETAAEGQKVKEVILYYNLDNAHYVPVDFGNPLKIDAAFFHFVEENVTVNSVAFDDKATGTLLYGTLQGENNTYYYSPNTVMLGTEKPIYFNLNVSVGSDDDDVHNETHSVIFVPATTVYYEEEFANLGNNWGGNHAFPGTDKAQETRCYGRIQNNYGYDPIYSGVAASSGTDATSTDTNSWAEFVFCGTGVEIYANCTPGTSNARVAIFSGTGSNMTLKKVYIVDTRMRDGKTQNVTTNQAVNAYNVPIASTLDLPYGTYTVRVGYMNSSDTRTDAFRFDGFRVYNTLLSDAEVVSLTAGDIYNTDKEKNPVFKEIRDGVLAMVQIPDSYDGMYADQIGENIMAQVQGMSEDITAMVVTKAAEGTDDTTTENVVDNESSNEIKVDLLENGPKNEVYLWPGQSLLLSVRESAIMQLGMKALNASVNCTYTVAGTNGRPEEKTVDLTTSTDMYYPVSYGEGDYIVITNNSGGILAVTKLKGVSDVVTSGLFRVFSARTLSRAMVSLGYSESTAEPENTSGETGGNAGNGSSTSGSVNSGTSSSGSSSSGSSSAGSTGSTGNTGNVGSTGNVGNTDNAGSIGITETIDNAKQESSTAEVVRNTNDSKEISGEKVNTNANDRSEEKLVSGGTYILSLGGKDAGTFTFTQTAQGWTIRNSVGTYLTLKGTVLVSGEEPFYWEYADNCFSAQNNVRSSNPFMNWLLNLLNRWFGIGGEAETCYLISLGDHAGVSGDRSNAEAAFYVEKTGKHVTEN